MNRTFLILVVILLWIILGIFLFNRDCCYDTKSASSATALPAVKNVDRNIFTIKDGNNFSARSPHHYSFLRSSFNQLNPSSSLENAINKLVTYLKGNTQRQLLITGHYDENNETDPSILDNLGLARANSLKRALIQMGISGSQIEIAAGPTEMDWFSGDTLMQGASFSFTNMPSENFRITEIKEGLVGKPITLYFATDSDRIDLSPEQKSDFTDLIYYLDNVSDSRLDVGGHTDDVGDRSYNINLSKERADFVRNYLRQRGGISELRMDIDGFGPDSPIASNDDEAGRAQNRRVEVTLK